MDPIHTIGELASGDVVYQPALGFAIVDEVAEDSADLAWENEGPRLPSRVSADHLSKGYRRCIPGGFLQKSVLGRDILQMLVQERPVAIVRMLIDELGESLGRSQIFDWMTGRNIIPSSQFDRWWETLEAAIEGDDTLKWDEGQRTLSLPEPTEEDAHPERFLASPPRTRWKIASEAEAEVRLRLMHQALTARDTEAILLLLRLGDKVPDKTRNALRKLAINGNHEVAAALLSRGDAHILQRLVAPAGRRERRTEVQAVLHQLAPSQCRFAAARMIEEALTIEGNPPAAAWLVTYTPGGVAALLDTAVQRGDCPQAVEWLTERTITSDSAHPSPPDSTIEDTVLSNDTLDITRTSDLERTNQPLVSQLRDLPAERLFTLSVATARALSDLHAAGNAGGVSGARVVEDGQVILGPREDRHPCEDVRDAMRVLLEAAVGPLPAERQVRDEELYAHVSLLRPDIPIDWLAVLSDALAEDPARRPADGIALWTRLSTAHANHTVRRGLAQHSRAQLHVAHDTHIGILKSRIMQTNQDAVFYSTTDDMTILLVGDGISVSTAGTGNLASALLVQSIAATWERSVHRLKKADAHQISDWLIAALAEANTAICEHSLQLAGGDLGQQIPMGTTAVLAIIRGNHAHIASVGDSRIYLVGDNGVSLLTGDQNVRGLWLETARRGESADFGNEGFALVGYCGRFDEHQEPSPAMPVMRTIRMLDGETLCLCSDGLTDYAAQSMADTNAIIAEGARHEDLAAGCRWLVDSANKGGGGDNISVILARIRHT